MTSIYEVTSKHTKEVLKDFIKFTYKVKYPKMTYRLSLLAGCFILLAVAFRDIPVGSGICGVIGFLVLIFTFNRHVIAAMKLAKVDRNYKNQSEIRFKFGPGGLAVENPEEDATVNARYSEISDIYKDKRNFFVAVNNEEVYVLPYADFKIGNTETFEEFLLVKTRKEMRDLNLPLMERLKRTNESRKRMEREHDEKLAEKKRIKKQEKAEQKKNK